MKKNINLKDLTLSPDSVRIINTPSEVAKSTFFYIQETGYLKSLNKHRNSRIHLSSFLFVVVLSGKGKLFYREKTYDLYSKDCFFINCMNPYSHESSDEDPWELLWVHFNGQTALEHYRYFRQYRSHIFQPAAYEKISEILRKLIKINTHKNYMTEILSSKYITDILTYSLTDLDSVQAKLSDTMSSKLESVHSYLNEHFTEHILLEDLSDMFYISKFHLAREFKNAYGITIGGYLQSKKITYAKELLRFTDKSIEEIGRNCGIEDPSYFNKVFKKSESITASAYRKLWE